MMKYLLFRIGNSGLVPPRAMTRKRTILGWHTAGLKTRAFWTRYSEVDDKQTGQTLGYRCVGQGRAKSPRQLHQRLQLRATLKTLKGLTPYEFICKQWTIEPERFTIDHAGALWNRNPAHWPHDPAADFFEEIETEP